MEDVDISKEIKAMLRELEGISVCWLELSGIGDSLYSEVRVAGWEHSQCLYPPQPEI